MTFRTVPCPASESWAFRTFRLAASTAAVLASALIAGASLINLVGFRQDSHRAASLAFALTSLLLVASCVVGMRQPRRNAIFALAAATALALGFTDLGRGVSRLPLTLSGVTPSGTIASLLAIAVGVVFLCTQIAASLARKNACNCG